jgi:hypothetical protein
MTYVEMSTSPNMTHFSIQFPFELKCVWQKLHATYLFFNRLWIVKPQITVDILNTVCCKKIFLGKYRPNLGKDVSLKII